MIVHFFERDPDAAPPIDAVESELQVQCWRPDADGFPARGSRRMTNLFWWVLAKSGGFRRSGFAELRIESGGELLHRLIVTPAWYRFPFMAENDLQIGDIWTSPKARRRQLARAAIGEAHRRFADSTARFWIVADADNLASNALARSCGYRLVATGRRTRRFGTALLGQFVIDRRVSDV